MSGETKEQRLAKVHERLLRDCNASQSAQRDERLQCLQDRRFYSIAGAPWEGDVGEQFANRPRFEVNKVHLAVIRIINEYRNNRITVNFLPKDGAKNDKLADTCNGLFRADMQDSCGEEAFDNGFEEGVGGGFGGWRLTTEYEDDSDEEDEHQRIRFIPVYDGDSCMFFDNNAKRQDKSDARRGYLLTAYTEDAYEDEWGFPAASIPKSISQDEFDWAPAGKVYVAEAYEIEEKKDKVLFYRVPSIINSDETNIEKHYASEFKDDENLQSDIEARGLRLLREKKVKVVKVHKYIMDGARILEDCGYIAGTSIPLIPFYGKRWFVDNIERCMGHVRLSKDAQRLLNMMLSMLAEISALSKVEKPILFPEQISGHQMMWAKDNVANYPYLLINPLSDQNGQTLPPSPVNYTKAPSIPPALAALLQITDQALQDLLGNQQAGEEMQPNLSGKAVELIQNRLDMQVFIYMSNMAKALKRTGEVWLGMAKDVYSETGRTMKTVAQDGSPGFVQLGQQTIGDDGEEISENDLSRAKLDVTSDVGPSAASHRAATVRAVTGMMQISQDPETQQVLTNLALMNMEGEGIADIRAWSRKKLLRMGVVTPTPEEEQELAAEAAQAAQKPDPQAEYLQAASNEANAGAQRAQADTLLKVQQAEKTRADAIKVISETKTEDQQRLMNGVQAIQEAVSLPARPDVLVQQ